MTEFEWLDIFGDNLKSLLEDANMTQRELADAAGISEACVSKYITKLQAPNFRAIINIAYALDIDISELIDFGERII